MGSLALALCATDPRRLKPLVVLSCVASLLLFAGFIFTLPVQSPLLTGLLLCFYRFFNLAATPLLLELAAQLAFPADESLAAGILQAPVQALNLAFVLVASGLFDAAPSNVVATAFAANLFFLALHAAAALLSFFIRFWLNRAVH